MYKFIWIMYDFLFSCDMFFFIFAAVESKKNLF